eukprot:355295-Chlamydomonas_euryale.AAC.1
MPPMLTGDAAAAFPLQALPREPNGDAYDAFAEAYAASLEAQQRQHAGSAPGAAGLGDIGMPSLPGGAAGGGDDDALAGVRDAGLFAWRLAEGGSASRSEQRSFNSSRGAPAAVEAVIEGLEILEFGFEFRASYVASRSRQRSLKASRGAPTALLS